MNICIIDNFDSFTFNLFEEFSHPQNTIHVWRNTMSADEVEKKINELSYPKLVVFSPGPGHPNEALLMNELIHRLKETTPIFGVCLGMQAIVCAFGGVVSNASSVVHGKARILQHDQTSIFKGLPDRIYIARYHSLAGHTISEDLRVFGHSENIPMAIEHKKYPIIGIQFHPESILTTYGSCMIENIIKFSKDFCHDK